MGSRTQADDGPVVARTEPDGGHIGRAHRALLGVCLAVALLSAVLVPFTLPLGWDELVYASRFSPYGPEAPFSAPRTRGVPLLLAPVASWSGSVVLLRMWLTALAVGALYLGFRPWLRVLHRPAAVPVAAALYGTLWFALFYTGSAMPNHYTAMGAAAAVGCFVQQRPRPGGVGPGIALGIALGLAVATLMRPNDAVWIAGPLLVAAAVVPAWRRRAAVWAVLAGTVAGALPWIVEAYVRFDGVLHRLAEASRIQGGMRPVLSVVEYATTLDGPLLCRPCTGDGVRLPALEWWVLLPLLVALGIWTVRKAGRSTAALWLATAVAGSAAAQYFFLVDYAAARFLLPAYALLALPAAIGLLTVADRARRSWPVAAVLAVVLLGHLSVQLTLARAHAGIQEQARGDWDRVAAVLREHGVRAPCALSGNGAVPVALTMECAVVDMDASVRPTAVVLRDREPPQWARTWQRFPVPGTYNSGWSVAVNPDAGHRSG
ncbi:hypothetical protein [Streptomyces gobiensis]|uniref:hypothetical protein n=1 Tax=Streptomyces gobiensis TaxID=2875706 RepID=UPI001E619714|nr:hypothetical protein [Streptomyces gobiensis]UGY91335.1 hypothetical protein test1122_06115 [Streptomyces gobiensis]